MTHVGRGGGWLLSKECYGSFQLVGLIVSVLSILLLLLLSIGGLLLLLGIVGGLLLGDD